MANRLADSSSPYLRQHAENPVDWWEWGEEAFAEARGRDVPILLSVGYAACHWCHVMAHESFEDDAVAEVLNAGWVSIKVDREERPDVDAVYMSAVQALTGRGGWPMTCLLTPAGEPFWAGTYLPREQFLQLLESAGDAWRDQRAELLSSAGRIASQLAQIGAPQAGAAIDDETTARAVASLRRSYDEARGGFGGAPKFPPSMVLAFLLRHHARTGDADALAMVTGTCEAMARGGMYDQLAGGFARYSVDANWVVPHFEKMLYDNAQLLRVCSHWYQATGSLLARRIASETADFIIGDLGTAEGLFASALDADTVIDGHSIEGATYVWTPAQLVEVLGEGSGARAASVLEVTDAGTFEHGSSTLQLRADPDDRDWWKRVREALLAARSERPQPARDDKAVTSWCGLAIAGLADASVILDRPALLETAIRCADRVLAEHVVDGRLRRASLGGVTGTPLAVLDDYGNLAEGLLALYRASGDPLWQERAGGLLDDAIRLFREGDLWYDTASDAEDLMTRPASTSDGAEPAGASAIAGALLTYAALTGSEKHRDAARSALAMLEPVARREPRFAGWALAVAEADLAGPLQVAIVGEGGSADALREIALASTSPGLVVASGVPDAPGQPLLEQRPLVGGRPAAYVCRGMVCDAPVTTVDALREALTR
ncbi:thioredoxin domain-containing protein [Janibacter sp. GXQ6167]|uniref:thioredoxin domain-containing protein n=1 Tax=Janibacter sp. GXQ6167 TaxID=3240791 RepID=UPI003523C5A2